MVNRSEFGFEIFLGKTVKGIKNKNQAEESRAEQGCQPAAIVGNVYHQLE
jgi:hypothetical protein